MHLHELVLQKLQSARALLFPKHLSFLAYLTVFHMCPSLSELAQMFAGPETDGTQKPHFPIWSLHISWPLASDAPIGSISVTQKWLGHAQVGRSHFTVTATANTLTAAADR